MKFRNLINNGHENLIVFFSGWSIEPDDFYFLRSENYDLTMFHSYSSFKIPYLQTAKYEKIVLVAYSLGVFAASVAMKYQKLPFDEIYAINGTGKPIDNRYGIRKMVFEKTYETLNKENLEAFQKNMFHTDILFERFSKNRNNYKSVNTLKKELQFFIDQNTFHDVDCSMFEKIVISDKDRIFPAPNQKRYWEGKNIEMIESGHFPFYQFKNWDEIIELCRK